MAGQKFWKKVKGEWVNTLALERAKTKEKIKPSSPMRKSEPRAKGGRAGKQFGGRTNLLEELGRVEGEPSNRNRRAEISRVHGELNRGYKHGERVKKAKGGRIGKQFGGGLPIQPTVGANLQPTVGANLQPPVGANPMGVADPRRRLGMKHGSKRPKGGWKS